MGAFTCPSPWIAARRLAAVAALAHSAALSPSYAEEPCAFDLVGTWKAETDTGPTYLNVRPDGWASILSTPGDTRVRPGDLEIVAQVRYELDGPLDPRALRFEARRGNDVLPAGESQWDIIAHTQTSFTTWDPSTELGTQWTRVQTHRYFITFAARAPEDTAFVMLTLLDGRSARRDGLGAYTIEPSDGDTTVRFGRIPEILARHFAAESEDESETMLRLELTDTEFRSARRLFDLWDMLLARGLLPDQDPHLQTLDFATTVIDSVNYCARRVALHDFGAGLDDPDGGAARDRLFELLRLLGAANARQHVSDRAFPFRWEPPRLD
jgi:hypothetical protein